MRDLKHIPPTRLASTKRSPERKERRRGQTKIANYVAKQQMILTFLLAGDSVQRAAERVGIDTERIYGWNNRFPEFKAAFHEAVATAKAAATDRLDGMLPKAVDVLEDVLKSSDTRMAWDGAYKLMKGRGVLTDSHELKGEITHRLAVMLDEKPLEELLALEAELAERKKLVEGSCEEVAE